MLKPSSLRDQLTAAVPWFAENPENLTLFINAGRIITTGTGTLSFEYAYTLQVVALGYAGHADALVVPMLEWISRNQPELLDNPDKRDKALRFNVEFLTDITTDIGFEIDLTERERVVLKHAAEGFTNAQIGEKLFISSRTVESHRANLMKKLNLGCQTDLVRFAIRRKIIAA